MAPAPSRPRLPEPSPRPHRHPADALDAPPLRGHRYHAQGLVLQRPGPPRPLGTRSPACRQGRSIRVSCPAELPGLRAGCLGDGSTLSRRRTPTRPSPARLQSKTGEMRLSAPFLKWSERRFQRLRRKKEISFFLADATRTTSFGYSIPIGARLGHAWLLRVGSDGGKYGSEARCQAQRWR